MVFVLVGDRAEKSYLFSIPTTPLAQAQMDTESYELPQPERVVAIERMDFGRAHLSASPPFLPLASGLEGYDRFRQHKPHVPDAKADARSGRLSLHRT